MPKQRRTPRTTDRTPSPVVVKRPGIDKTHPLLQVRVRQLAEARPERRIEVVSYTEAWLR